MPLPFSRADAMQMLRRRAPRLRFDALHPCVRRGFCSDSTSESSGSWFASREELETMINADASAATVADHLRTSPMFQLEMYVRAASEEEFGISEAGLGTLAEAMAGANTITKLVLYGDGLGTAGAEALAAHALRSSALTHMALYGAHIGHSGSAAFGAALASDGAALAELDLDYCSIGASGSAALAEALHSSTSLVRLNLLGNSIRRADGTDGSAFDEAGVDALCRLLARGTRLRNLSLKWNEMDDTSAMALATCLRGNASLKQLDLRGNKAITLRAHRAFEALFDGDGDTDDEPRALAVHVDALQSDQRERARRSKGGKRRRPLTTKTITSSQGARTSASFLVEDDTQDDIDLGEPVRT